MTRDAPAPTIAAMQRIGIRAEDKSRWERRVPLVPVDVQRLVRDHRLKVTVQSSPSRAFVDDAYRDAGARTAADLADCPIIVGVKEVPVHHLEPVKTYVFFSHTIKGQWANMPMLRRLMGLKCQLIDYEKITDASGRRLVFFGRFAGLAGMIDTLWAFGRRWLYEGVNNPFTELKPAHEYRDSEHARRAVSAVGERIRREGLPAPMRPLVCGFAGYGNVSQGAQEMFDLLPVREVAPCARPELEAAAEGPLADARGSANVCYKVVFREEHMVERIDASAPFQLQEYYQHPERYCAKLAPYLPHLSILVNGIYWEAKYPRLVTLDDVRSLWSAAQPPRLRVIGDISCDISGSIECTVKATEPGDPVYVYEPATGSVRDGVEGKGPVILAVDILPCELPVDASNYFSHSLSPLIPPLARANFQSGLDAAGLPDELRKATILWHGELTEPYRYLKEFVQ